jgi:alpha-N-arabinofuranosidase
MLEKDMLDAISVSASRDKSGAVHISLVNIDAKNTQDVSLTLGGLSARSVTGRILRSGKLQDHNTFDNPQMIKPAAFNDAALNGNNLSVKMPPFSVVVLELK